MRLFALKVPNTVQEDVFDRLLHQLPESGQDRVRKFRHEGDAIIDHFCNLAGDRFMPGQVQNVCGDGSPAFPPAFPLSSLADGPGSLAGRLLPTYYLRTANILSPTQHPRFKHGPRGKPFLSDPAVPGLDFNTSHEGDYVLLAVVHGAEGKTDVGVDVMDLPSDPDELADSIGFQLSTLERLQVAAATGRVKAKLLTTLWTIKEGFTKATGDGISFGLDRIEVALGDGTVTGVKVDGKDVREDGWTWTVGSIDAGAYGYAVIWRGEDSPAKAVEVERIPWDEFVRVFIGSRGVSVA